MFINDSRVIKRGNKLFIIPQSRLVVRSLVLSENKVIKFDDWGRRIPKYNNLVLSFYYDSIVIHHSGNRGIKEPNNIEHLHMVKKQYDHVGYHFLINSQGKVFEGRSLLYKGAHVRASNSRKIGIVLMGDFDEQWWDIDDKLTTPQLQSLNNLIESLVKYYKVEKLGGHKEFLPGQGYTCPGNVIMEIMNDMREKHALQKP